MATTANSSTGTTVQKPLLARGDLDFDLVIRDEIEDINLRRVAVGREEQTTDIGYGDDRQMLDATGLALSGGGIRSAAFCLGVLQGLNHFNVVRNIDYLSTVSGGGYIGASLSATMTKTAGYFPYGGGDVDDAAQPPEQISDTASVSHIRNYSNYLIPFGLRDVLTAIAIILRGLVANLSQVLVVLLALAALTVAINPVRSKLIVPDPFGLPLNVFPSEQFGFTTALALLLPVLFLAWGLYRSALARIAGSHPGMNRGEFRGVIPKLAVFYLVLLALAAFCEAQPFVIEGMFEQNDVRLADIHLNRVPDGEGVFLGLVSSWVDQLALIAAPIVALVATFRKSLSEMIGAAGGNSPIRAKIAGLLARSLVWIAGAALPLLIWVGYLHLSYWAIPNDRPVDVPAVACPADGASGVFTLGEQTGSFSGALSLDNTEPCRTSGEARIRPPKFGHAPGWIIDLSPRFGEPTPLPAPAVLYVVVAAIVFIILLFLTPNANSLHRLYRDRLSKAFLFDPTAFGPGGGVAGDRDLAPCDAMRLTDLQAAATPYQLINAALNIQGSDFANRRGRDADFFMFSRRYVGGPATGYAPTAQMEKKAADLDLATALAISGAAASSNMGSKSVRALTPTLALLNVRLGYWLANPYFAFYGEPGDTQKDKPRTVLSYLSAEIFSRLDEDKDVVYVTDGGHIENLGIYELLRRRCKLIVAVDAEADPDMRFTSLVTLERYARIDLGVRISIPLQHLARTTRSWMGCDDASPRKDDEPDAPDPTHGPHVVVGTIDYGCDEKGSLVYVKSSLSGDESDYIREYARRYKRFPHETTGDQFFSEEQFEVYRALGFHAMFGFLRGSDEVVVEPTMIPAPQPGLSSPVVSAATTPPPTRRALADGSIVTRAHDPALGGIRQMLLEG